MFKSTHTLQSLLGNRKDKLSDFENFGIYMKLIVKIVIKIMWVKLEYQSKLATTDILRIYTIEE